MAPMVVYIAIAKTCHVDTRRGGRSEKLLVDAPADRWRQCEVGR